MYENNKKITAITVSFLSILISFNLIASADAADFSAFNNQPVQAALDYLSYVQDDNICWSRLSDDPSANITDILEILEMYGSEFLDYDEENFNDVLSVCMDYYWHKHLNNVDDISNYLLVNELQEDDFIVSLLLCQNSDGGFGLTEGYASDIIDTNLALKALADLGETEAMTNAAVYIASLQNADGGFSYQQGLASNPELTAEIADIFGDCIIKDKLLDYVLKI